MFYFNLAGNIGGKLIAEIELKSCLGLFGWSLHRLLGWDQSRPFCFFVYELDVWIQGLSDFFIFLNVSVEFLFGRLLEMLFAFYKFEIITIELESVQHTPESLLGELFALNSLKNVREIKAF